MTQNPPPEEIFRAYDIRGVAGAQLTTRGVRAIGRALGSLGREKGCDRFVVGRDGRHSGPELAGAVGEGLRAAGCSVIDIGCVPTPVVYYATHALETGCGVAVTGSHNPPEYNGLKMMVAGETLSGAAIGDLRRRILAQDFATGDGEYRAQRVDEDYLDRIAGDVTLARRMKVVIDCGNGVAGAVAPALFERLGCDLDVLYGEVDGDFPNHHPDPSKPENLADLIAAVRRREADVGLAFDGDGDRLGVVTAAGDVIWPDRLMMLFARDVLSRNPGAKIIFDVKCTRHLPRVIAAADGEPVMSRTGHSLIKARMKELAAPLAGEMSGHIFFKERWYGFDDGLYAGARLLEYLSRQVEPAQAVFDALPDSVNTPELNLRMAEGEPRRLVARLQEMADFPEAQVTTIDGLRVDFADGFGLARASNTTPVVVLRFEGDSDAAVARIQERFRALLEGAGAPAALPF